MAELTFKSPGISTREIDLTGPTKAAPVGTPAGVIGTSQQGRAFVPITFATFADFVVEFGETDSTRFGPLAIKQWMRHAKAGTYLRVLGVGDAKKRGSDGTVTNAGFVVGAKLPGDNGYLKNNKYAGTISGSSPTGRTYFLGCIMKEQNSSGLFTNAGLRDVQPIIRGVILAPSGVLPALSASRRGGSIGAAAAGGPGMGHVDYDFSGNNTALAGPSGGLNAASGSSPSTTSTATIIGSNKWTFGSTGSINNGGSSCGAINIANGRQEFVMLLNGHSHTDEYPTILTASFDPTAPNYFQAVFNTDPTKTQQAGHCLHAWWNIYPNLALPTGSSLVSPSYSVGLATSSYANPCSSLTGPDGVTMKLEDIALLLTASQLRGAGTTAIPDFESFEDRFRTAVSPWVCSQKFGGQRKDLFRVHALDDGAIGNTRVKISIENIAKSTNDNAPYGSFDLSIRDYNDTDDAPIVIEKYNKCTLDPSDDRFIGRLVGDMHIFYDFDKRVGSQKLAMDGSYPNKSNYVRVEIPEAVKKAEVPAESLPVGFRGIQHLVTSGSGIFVGQMDSLSGSGGNNVTNATTGVTRQSGGQVCQMLVQPPIPMRSSVSLGTTPKKRLASNLYWGVQFDVNDRVTEPNRNIETDSGIASFGTYFPNYNQSERAAMVGNNAGVADSSGTILDSDRFNNNIFSLENVQVIVNSSDKADSAQWAAATYRRKGEAESSMNNIDGTSKSGTDTRLLSVDKDFPLTSARKFLKYTFILQGGFDGVNILDKQRKEMSNLSVRREMTDADQGETDGSTVAAYRKALDVMSERSDISIQILAIPGIRHKNVTDYAVQTVEERFDAMYIMDIPQYDQLNNVITGSTELPNVSNTVTSFQGRNMDSSFAAAYYPDVILSNNGTSVVVPPSVAVLGAFALNDAVAYPWFAPAGFTRGGLAGVTETKVKLNRANLDALYDVDINPITSFPQTKGEVVVFGQKTLLAAQSALDRVNVRRLLIDIRRQVRAIGDSFLFEPNRESTLGRFAAAVQPVLARIQQQQGLERFKVQIDTTTTTQADVENNTVRGKIFLQPVRSVEFISLDFVVTNAGTDI
jgi:phage tail sheath protein FI